jgi:hypothetical protein
MSLGGNLNEILPNVPNVPKNSNLFEIREKRKGGWALIGMN